MAEQPKENQWIPLPLGLPLKRDYPYNVLGAEGGGAVIAKDVDLRSKKGAVLARKLDESIYPNPTTVPLIRVLAQNTNGRDGSKPYAILGSVNMTSNLMSFAVRGFKKLDGSEVANDWVLPPDARIDCDKAMLQHDGQEVRVHCRTPKYYGLPGCITEPVTDWKYAGANTEVGLDEFRIDGPFGASNEIALPKATEIQARSSWFDGIYQLSDGENGYPEAMWGSRFRYAYWGISYLYDGYQESPLYIEPSVSDYKYDSNGTPHGYLSAACSINVSGVRYGGQPYTVLNRRIRKIRLYCAPSETLVDNPRRELKFYLANEIDVSKWDSETEANRNRFAAFQQIHGELDGHLRIDFTDGQRSFHYGRWQENAIRESLRVKIGKSKTVFRIESLSVEEIGAPTVDFRIRFVIPISQLPEFREAMGRYGYLRPGSGSTYGYILPIVIYSVFTNESDSPVHTSYVGDEITVRPTYENLSGLSQDQTDSISPPRLGGVTVNGRTFIHGVTDKDGKFHPGRVMYSGFAPSALPTPDRFLDCVDFGFSVQRIKPMGSTLLLVGPNEIATWSIAGGDESNWFVSDARQGLGCVSADSLAETPYGIAYLSTDGVRLLDRAHFVTSEGMGRLEGVTPAGLISEPIRDLLAAHRIEWQHARGVYCARTNQYILHFPAFSRKMFAFDFEIKGWVEIVNEKRIMAACLGADGAALLAMQDLFQLDSGIYRYSTSAEDSPFAEYALKMIFGDRLRFKWIRRLLTHFTKHPSAEKLNLTITTEDTQATLPSYSPDIENGMLSTTVGMEDRAVTFSFSGFNELESIMVEVEPSDRKGFTVPIQ